MTGSIPSSTPDKNALFDVLLASDAGKDANVHIFYTCMNELFLMS